MAHPQSPLVGYNTNVRHKGRLYHIQTEDSGINHPHVITHLFADGGRIIASRKTSYADQLGADDLSNLVRKLMQEQHKAIFIELRDCVYDDDDEESGKAAGDGAQPAGQPEVDVDALEAAAAARAAESVASRARSVTPKRGAGHYQQTVPASSAAERAPIPDNQGESIFGGSLLQGKSLDEVILSYLSDDLGEND